MSSNEKKLNWFKYWFNTPYYHILYGNRDYTEAELFIERLIKHLSFGKESRVLDLACGKGRHAFALSNYYNHVTGVDISENSIIEAQKLEKPGLKFHTHDMRNAFYINYFDLVTNLFTSFGYFQNERDNYKAISSTGKALKKGGILVLDFMNADKVIKKLVASEVKELQGITFNISREFDGRFICKHIKFNADNEDFHFTEKVQGVMIEDFERYLNHGGFEIISTFGDYQLNPFNIESSDRLIIIAKKL